MDRIQQKMKTNWRLRERGLLCVFTQLNSYSSFFKNIVDTLWKRTVSGRVWSKSPETLRNLCIFTTFSHVN